MGERIRKLESYADRFDMASKKLKPEIEGEAMDYIAKFSTDNRERKAMIGIYNGFKYRTF